MHFALISLAHTKYAKPNAIGSAARIFIGFSICLGVVPMFRFHVHFRAHARLVSRPSSQFWVLNGRPARREIPTLVKQQLPKVLRGEGWGLGSMVEGRGRSSSPI